MREFHGDDPARLQQDCHSRDKIVQIGNLGKDIVAEEQVGLFAGCSEFARRLCTKELHQRRNTPFDSFRGNIRGRLDAEDWHALLDEVLK